MDWWCIMDYPIYSKHWGWWILCCLFYGLKRPPRRISAAQCSLGARRFWRRQVKAWKRMGVSPTNGGFQPFLPWQNYETHGNFSNMVVDFHGQLKGFWLIGILESKHHTYGGFDFWWVVELQFFGGSCRIWLQLGQHQPAVKIWWYKATVTWGWNQHSAGGSAAMLGAECLESPDSVGIPVIKWNMLEQLKNIVFFQRPLKSSSARKVQIGLGFFRPRLWIPSAPKGGHQASSSLVNSLQVPSRRQAYVAALESYVQEPVPSQTCVIRHGHRFSWRKNQQNICTWIIVHSCVKLPESITHVLLNISI